VLKGRKNTKGFKEKNDIGRDVTRGRSIVTILRSWVPKTDTFWTGIAKNGEIC
jgi:hypothetical protein